MFSGITASPLRMVVGGRWPVVGEETKTDHWPPTTFHRFRAPPGDMNNSPQDNSSDGVLSANYHVQRGLNQGEEVLSPE
jgi:hypothetical protein